MGNIVLLVIVVVVFEVKEGVDFFLFIVDYKEKFVVGGKILGGFFCCEVCFFENEIFIMCFVDCVLCLFFLDDYYVEV